MQHNKKIVPIKQSKKKIVKKTGVVKNQKIFSTKVLIGTAILFITLFILIIFSSNEQTLRGNASQISPVAPTYGSLSDCSANHDCPTGTLTKDSQQINSSQQENIVPTGMIIPGNMARAINSNSASNPCTAAASKTTSQSTGNQNFLQLILQFFQLLLQFLQQLLGGGGSGTTPGNPQPSLAPSVVPSVSPVPSVGPSPCPQATSAPAPSGSTSEPTSVPAPTSGTTTASCVTSDFMGRCPSSGYYTDPQIIGGTNPWVNQNVWGAGGTNYQQTLNANSAGDWYITASVSNNSSGAVLTFPNTGWSMPTKTIDSYSTITSSWNVTIPTDNKTSAGWAAYDLWFNNWADEVMIQTDIVANSNYNCSSAASTTINGQAWHLCDFGSERVVKPGTNDNSLRNEASGSVDVKAVLQWLEQTGHLPASSTWTAGSFGFEVSNTSGTTQTFKVNGFTWTSQ
jgi:hypothetical protein